MATATIQQNPETIAVELPTERVDKWLLRLLNDGLSPEEATEKALLPLKATPGYYNYYVWARPGMLSQARTLHRNIGRRLERAALSPTASEGVWRKAVERLSNWTFKDGQNNNVVWKDSTREQHLSRILWIEVQERGLAQDKIRHQCAVELFDEHGVEHLSDIENWEELWRDKVIAQGVEPMDTIASGAETAQVQEALANPVS